MADWGPEDGRAPGIRDIARLLDVSIGTVDRALHGRAGISPLTRAKVLKTAQSIGYQPNFAARHLKLQRKLRVAVLLPRQIAFFFDAIRAGIREAALPFRSSIELEFRDFPRLGEGDLEVFSASLAAKVNGIIVTPAHPAELRPWIRKAARAHVPVVCVATDAPKTERLSSVSVDAFTSGATAAELLASLEKPSKRVLIVTGDLTVVDHAQKVTGFEKFLASAGGDLEIAQVIEAHDEPARALEETRRFLAREGAPGAVYITTANALPVVNALEEGGAIGRVRVITTDLFPALTPLIRSGKVFATLYQRPKSQGRLAFQALYQFLAQGTCPPPQRKIPPHLVLRSNLDLFLSIMPGEGKGEEAAWTPGQTAQHGF